MKTKILTIIGLSFSLTGLLFAQTPKALNVVKTDQTVVSTKLSDLKKITFVPANESMKLHTNNGETEIPFESVRSVFFGDYDNVSTDEKNLQNVRFAIYGTEQIHICCSDGIRRVDIYTIAGQLVHSNANSNLPTSLLLSTQEMAQGVYVVKVTTASTTVSQKIIIK